MAPYNPTKTTTTQLHYQEAMHSSALTVPGIGLNPAMHSCVKLVATHGSIEGTVLETRRLHSQVIHRRPCDVIMQIQYTDLDD